MVAGNCGRLNSAATLGGRLVERATFHKLMHCWPGSRPLAVRRNRRQSRSIPRGGPPALTEALLSVASCMCGHWCRGEATEPPKWIKPQLTRVTDESPAGDDWLHEIKFDGYRMHARLDRGKVQLLTRTGLDWSRRYPRTIEVLRSLPVQTAYLDGELCEIGR